MMQQSPTFRSHGTDHIGDLSAKLVDLQGYDSIANELLQNADDAQATCVVFDVCDDTLIVENNAVFKDCGHQDQEDCPWLFESAIQHKCDFHRFRRIAGGDKRNEAGTTGAFGFGFVSVYQITNNPEVISNTLHWKISPDATENCRIAELRIEPFLSTRFVFPWATDPECSLRKRLRVAAITPEAKEAFCAKVVEAVPRAILFLRHVCRVEIKRNGCLLKVVERVSAANTVTIIDDEVSTLWHIFTGNFSEAATMMRRNYPTYIEDKRRSQVTIALSNDSKAQGNYYATLPTQETTGLPIHINADFYPQSNRKRLAFGTGYEGAWNEAAIRAAANALASALPQLSDLLGYKGLWRLLSQIEHVHRNARDGHTDKIATVFWDIMKPVAKSACIVYTSIGEWRTPGKALLLQNREQEQPCLPILEQFGLSIVHPELNDYHPLLTSIGVSIFDAFDLSEALTNQGLDKAIALADAPNWLRDSEQHELLASEIEILLNRKIQNAALARSQVAACAVARSTDNWFCKPSTIRQATPDVIERLVPLNVPRLFAAFDNPVGVQSLISKITVTDIVEILEKVPQSTFARLLAQTPGQLLDIIGMCAANHGVFQSKADLRGRLSRLRIWPANDALHALNELVVPGNFTDPFNLSTVIDPRVVTKCKEFLIDVLSAPVLTVQHYAGVLVPARLKSDSSINSEHCRRLIAELAEHIDVLREDTKVRQALAACPLIPCSDGSLRIAGETYFPTQEVSDLLGAAAPTAFVPAEKAAQYKDFLGWLGVADFPRPKDIIAHIQSACQHSAAPISHRNTVRQIFHELGKYWGKYSAEQRKEFELLRSAQWLPAKERYERWFAPSEVHTQFRSYLFESTGVFLDVPVSQQRDASALIEFIGIRSEPSCQQVVSHVLNSATSNKEVNKRVYDFLNIEGNVHDPEVRRLKGRAILLLDGIGYVRPDQVFWESHAFHPFLYTLSQDFRAYGQLLDVLGVRAKPQAAEAIKILCDFADGNENKRVGDSDYAVIMHCWTLITDSLQKEEIEPALLEPLRTRKVVPNNDRIIELPTRMFFEDRPNLAARFGEWLQANVIQRPAAAWLGMEETGVRSLSRAVKMTLVACDDPVPAEDLQRVLFERRHLIERVVDPMRAETRENWNTDLLDRLQLHWCSRLEVGYTFNGFTPHYTSSPERADTFFDPQEDILYVLRAEVAPWRKIASGLAFAMNQDAEVGKVAPGLAYALDGRTVREANEALDDLGIPPLQQRETFDTPAARFVGMGGLDAIDPDINIDDGPLFSEDDAPGEFNNAEVFDDADENTQQPLAPDKSSVADGAGTASQKNTASNPHTPHPQNAGNQGNGAFSSGAPAPTSVTGNSTRPTDTISEGVETPSPSPSGAPQTDASRVLDNTDAHSPSQHQPRYKPQGEPGTQMPSEPQRKQVPQASTHSAPSHDSDARTEYSGRMKSYVFSGRDPDAEPGARARKTEPIDRAGIMRVLAAEEQAGRDTEEMAHSNPGYDIYALDANGTERYIEVKSLSGTWQTKGVMVSATQFNFAREKGLSFWLYVVERADKDDFQITRIQNPARRVGEFMFDDGWRELGEQTDPV